MGYELFHSAFLSRFGKELQIIEQQSVSGESGQKI
jgi:hypothetical protein